MIRVLFGAGTAAAANGITADVDVSLDAAGAGSAGDDFTVTATVDTGAATGQGFSDGLDKSVALSVGGGLVLPAIGDAFEGGFYAGLISHTADGVPTHALIVAPRASGASGFDYPISTALAWKTSLSLTAGTSSTFDGAANTAAMVTAGIGSHPAANFCVGLSIGGFSDWYLPARFELDIAYENLKPSTANNSTSWGINDYSVPKRTLNRTTTDPAQTSVSTFQSAGVEFIAFSGPTDHYSSTQIDSTNAWALDFASGSQNANQITFGRRVRAFRKVAL
jgi:hypothetical protein